VHARRLQILLCCTFPARLKALMERSLGDLQLCAIVIDGTPFNGVGSWQGTLVPQTGMTFCRLDSAWVTPAMEEASAALCDPNAITIPGMVTGATDLALLRAKGVQAYGIGPPYDETEFAEHGWHSNVERLSEDSVKVCARDEPSR
jgi:hypothetical protein